MTFLSRLFGQPDAPRILEHPVFGRLRFSGREGWQNAAFTLWGFQPVDLVISAGLEGPSERQVEEFSSLRDSGNALWPRCLAALERVRADLRVRPGRFRVSGLSVPSHGANRAGDLWTLWVDLEGDDHFMYGVQSEDGWRTFAAFADD